jgi:hypothetical protein
MKKNKDLFPLILLLLLSIATSFTSCGKSGTEITPTPTPPPAVQPPQTPQTPVAYVDTIKSGVNLQPSYYNNGKPNFAWPLMMQQSKIKTLRIEIEPDKVNQAITWIAEAKHNGYQVIATWVRQSTGFIGCCQLVESELRDPWRQFYYQSDERVGKS